MLKLKLQYFQAPGPKSQLTGNDPDAGIYWGQEKKWAVAEDERVRQHHWFNAQGFEPAVGGRDGQTSLVCCSLWSHSQTCLSNLTMRTALPNSEMFNVKYFNSGPHKYFYLWALEFSWFIWYLCLVAQSCLTLCTPMDCTAHQDPLSTEFSRQEYWSELPCPPPEDLSNPGTEPWYPALHADSLPSEPPEKPSDI